jgi:hypothetical protein
MGNMEKILFEEVLFYKCHFFRLSRAATAVDKNLCHTYSLDHKTLRAEILSPGLI